MSKSKPQKMGISGTNGFLGAFISEEVEPTIALSENEDTITEIEIRKIYRPKQQRLFFDPSEISKLKDSIRAEGFRGAVLVSPLPSDHESRREGYEYELVYGASRVLACEELGQEIIRSEIRVLTSQQIRRIRFDENMVRKNLNPYEELSGYLELMCDEAAVTIEVVEQQLNAMSNASKRDSSISADISNNLAVYQKVLDRYNGGKLTTFRSKLIKFRSLPEDIKEIILEGKIDASKALEIGSVKDFALRQSLLNWTIEENPSVAAIRARKKELIPSSNSKESESSPNLKKATSVVERFSSLIKEKNFNQSNKKISKLLDQITDLIQQIEDVS